MASFCPASSRLRRASFSDTFGITTEAELLLLALKPVFEAPEFATGWLDKQEPALLVCLLDRLVAGG